MPSDLQPPDQSVESYVLPMALMEQTDAANSRVIDIHGTGFLIANGRGLGITAGHVAKALESLTTGNFYAAAMFRLRNPDRSQAFRIQKFEHHASEDVALFRLPDEDLYSPYTLSSQPENASAETMLWGYPDEIRRDYPTEGLNVELIYSASHIRRRISREIPRWPAPGRAFYEIGDPAGTCASGSPVSLRHSGRAWRAIGIYVGERRDRVNHSYAVGIVTRADALTGQWPQLFDQDNPGRLAELCPLN